MLGIEKLRDALYGDDMTDEAKVGGDPIQERKLWGKAFLAGVGLLLFLLLIFYAALETRVSSLKAELQEKITAAELMSKRLGEMEAKIAKMDPAYAQKLIFKTYVGEMSQKAASLAAQATEEQKAVLAKIQEQLATLSK